MALVSYVSKVLLAVILERIKSKTGNELSDEQAGFRKSRGAIQGLTYQFVDNYVQSQTTSTVFVLMLNRL